MSQKLRESAKIWKLASDLGLQPSPNAVSAILESCRKKIRSIAKEYKCTVLSDLLSAVAAVLGTTFIEIHSESHLVAVRNKYLKEGEKAFATLHQDLGPDVLAITFRRTTKRRWERRFVSVIDCRGEKSSRSYYSKWHELAHLLTLTGQMRLSFTRTHTQSDQAKDPEEALMEVIAGTFGFWGEILAPKVRGRITFDSIDQLRGQHCPDASVQASVIGFVNAWPSPCVLLQAALGIKERDKQLASQKSFGFGMAPIPELRAVKVSPNDAAREVGIIIYRNMRVPDCSVIHNVFYGEISEGKAEEDLGDWATSNGAKLAHRRVVVEARRTWGGVEALITPL